MSQKVYHEVYQKYIGSLHNETIVKYAFHEIV